jgi:hypothetical protein
MAKQIQITIPEPCHEKWEEMIPTQQGAYCKVCSKNVVDFTTKTENEIYDILTQSDGNTCGRFTTFQLQYPIRKTEINNGWFNWRAIAASLAALVAFEETARASGNKEKCIVIEAPQVEVVSENLPEEETEDVIRGVVVDRKTYDRVPLALLIWQDDSTTIETNLDGEFAIANIASHKNPLLFVKAIGYETEVIDVNSLRRNKIVELFPNKLLHDSIITIVTGKVSLPTHHNIEVTTGSVTALQSDTVIKLNGKVEDAQTGKPIALANVSNRKSDITSVTNKNGQFSITLLRNGSKGDMIWITYEGYEPLIIPVSQVYENIVFKLKRKSSKKSDNNIMGRF